MADPDPSDAAEYVLGTLTAEERQRFEGLAQNDPALQADIRAWEQRLAPLAARVTPHPVPERLWARVEQRLGWSEGGPSSATVLDFEKLRVSRRRWRVATLLTGAAAAVLAIVSVAAFRDAGTASRYVAVVNRGGQLPALVVNVNARDQTVQVRSLATETPPGRSLELWYVGAGDAPRSLGVLGRQDDRYHLPAIESSTLNGGTFAVSVEPSGGSITGSPTGPVVYSGKLLSVDF